MSPAGQDVTPSRVVGLAGTALLVLGVFTPVVSVPHAGGVTYFGQSPWNGSLMLALACAGALMCVGSHRWALWVPGVAALLTTGESFFDTTTRMGAQRADALGDLVGSPLAGVIEGAANTGQYGLGWVVLLAGGVLVVVAAYVSDGSPTRVNTPWRA